MKEKEVDTQATSLPDLLSSILPIVVEVNEEGNEKRNDKEENPIVAPLKPSEEQKGNEQEEGDKTTFESEEHVAIQTMVTLPVTTPLPSSHTLQRPSTQDTLLQISRPSSSTP